MKWKTLLARLGACARPGARMLVTSTCRGGSLVSAVLDVWRRITEGAAALPDPDELSPSSSPPAGGASARNLLPGDRFFRFVAYA